MYVWSPLPRSLPAALRDAVHAKPRVRLSAVADLVRWVQSEEPGASLPRLIELAEHDTDLEVRSAALLGLADAGAELALPALLRAARSGPARVRQMALVALGELAAPEDDAACDVVRAALDSDAPALRFQALVAAGRLLGEAELDARLQAALGDAESRLRYIACRIAEERFFGSQGADAERSAALAERLAPLLSDAAPEVAIAAALVLARRGSGAARDVLVAALNRRQSFAEPEDEQAAIDLCAELGERAALPGLRARAFGGMFGGSSPLAFRARVALARLGDERAIEHILRGLGSWSRSTRAQAVAAAGMARLQAARPRLLELRASERELDHSSVAEALLALDR